MGRGKEEKMRMSKPIAVVCGGSLGDRHHSVHPVFRRGAAPEKIGVVRTGGKNNLQRVKNGVVNGEDIEKKN